MLLDTTLGLVTTICQEPKVNFGEDMCGVFKVMLMKICWEPRMTFVDEDDNVLWGKKL